MANKLEIKLNMPSDPQLDKMFDAVPKLERYKVFDQTMTAGARPVVARARALTPRNRTPNKRSKNQRAGTTKAGDKIDWDYPTWKTIGRVIRKYAGRYGMAIIGPSWPKGNKAYFNTSPKGNKGNLWGSPGKRYMRRGKEYTAPPNRPRAQIRNWIVQAFDETQGQQLSAMKAKLQTLTDQMMREK